MQNKHVSVCASLSLTYKYCKLLYKNNGSITPLTRLKFITSNKWDHKTWIVFYLKKSVTLKKIAFVKRMWASIDIYFYFLKSFCNIDSNFCNKHFFPLQCLNIWFLDNEMVYHLVYSVILLWVIICRRNVVLNMIIIVFHVLKRKLWVVREIRVIYNVVFLVKDSP